MRDVLRFNSMNKTYLTFGVVVVAVAAFFVFRGSSNTQPVATATPTPTPEFSANPSVSVMESASPSGSPAAKDAVKEFAVTGTSFAFTPKTITVKKGDTVRIVFTNAAGFHDWVIDEFNARTPQIGAGKTATVEFVASKIGSFEYYCSVGNHRAQGMVGTLVVQ